jgi:hypothetical protein
MSLRVLRSLWVYAIQQPPVGSVVVSLKWVTVSMIASWDLTFDSVS